MKWNNWLRCLANRTRTRSTRKGQRAQKFQQQLPLHAEFLEVRTLLAGVTDGGGATLTIDLDNASENVTVTTDGSTYTFTTSASFTNGGTVLPGTDFSEFGGSTLTVNA